MALTKITPQMFDTSATAHDLNVDNGTFVVDGSASRVGIGTPTPSTLLDVNGVLTATSIAGTLTTAAQTNITSVGTLSSLTVSGNSQLGSVDIYDNGALGVVAADTGHDLELRGRSSQAVNIVSGGTTTAVFDASGNVGIGITPTSKFTINDSSALAVSYTHLTLPTICSV